MKRVSTAMAAAGLMCTGLVACGGASSTGSGTSTPTSRPHATASPTTRRATATSTASTSQAVAHVYIVNHAGNDEFAFRPKVLHVRVGTQVVWLNQSSQPHTVTQQGEHITFNSGTQSLINRGQGFSHVFDHTGKYPYYCLLHPYMTATIIVDP